MEEVKQVTAAPPIPWQVKFFVLAAILAVGALYIYNKFIVVCRLGPLPIGWYEVPHSRSIEHIKFQPCETRLIRCDSAINRVFVQPYPYSLMVWIDQTNTAKIDMQAYRLKPEPFHDVPKGKPIWVQLRQHVSDSGEEAFSDAEIHIHSEKTPGDIAGAILEKTK